jgi:hypothetical protein
MMRIKTRVNAICLASGTPLDTDHFLFHDTGRRITPHDKYALQRASKALDTRAPYAIAAATGTRVVAHAAATSAEEAAKELLAGIDKVYGENHRPALLALIANFYPDEAFKTLEKTDSKIYLVTRGYRSTKVRDEVRCIDDWTKRNEYKAKPGTGRQWEEYKNMRSLIQPRTNPLGLKQKRGDP